MAAVRRRELPPVPVYLALAVGAELCLAAISTATALYRVREAGLDPLQLVLVGTVLEAAAFLGEVPTGVVADVFSRRLSVCIGYALMGAGFLLEGSLPIFAAILLAQVVWGLGSTFISGAEQAWIADEVGEAAVGRVYLRAAQAGQVGALVGIGVGIGLGSLRTNLPILAGGAGFVALAVALALTMPERHFHRTPRGERSTFRAMGETFAGGLREVRGRPVLGTILLIALIAGAASEAFDRLWEAHLLAAFDLPDIAGLGPIALFGGMRAGALLLGIVAAEVVRRRVDLERPLAATRALCAVDAALVLAVVAYALAGDFALAIVAYWATSLLRRLHDPLAAAWINRGLDPKVRATVLSMRGQADALGQVTGGPALGAVASAISIRAALAAAGLVLSPTLALYARTLRRGKA